MYPGWATEHLPSPPRHVAGGVVQRPAGIVFWGSTSTVSSGTPFNSCVHVNPCQESSGLQHSTVPGGDNRGSFFFFSILHSIS